MTLDPANAGCVFQVSCQRPPASASHPPPATRHTAHGTRHQALAPSSSK